MALAIKAENISKVYQLGEIGTGTITRDIERWFAKVRGKEDPFLKIGETNDPVSRGKNDMIWSLKDINFEINQGEAVGIIGRNGAGKSTLLKVLSRVTSPTRGGVKVKGRIASLLEVGTGFHPELTGRENIYLNGAILGMRKKEITRKFDEIVDFAGIERYIDTPVKRYSSGMYVRLAFAVAAHLDSEILIVDEVLAVGDAEFQKKCIGKMGDVSKGEGRTVLFVSHNMASIRSLCERGIVLEQGKLGIQGNINTAIEYYKQKALKNSNRPLMELKRMFHSDLEIDDIIINGERSQEINLDTASSMLNVRIKGTAKDKMNFNIEIRIYTSENTLVTFYSPGHMKGEVKAISKGEFILEDTVLIPKFMASGEYILQIQLSNPNIETYFSLEDIRLVKSDIQTVTGRTLSYNDIGFFLMERDERLSTSI